MNKRTSKNPVVNELLDSLYDYDGGSRTVSPAFFNEVKAAFKPLSTEDIEALGNDILKELYSLNGLHEVEYGQHDLTDTIAFITASMTLADVEEENISKGPTLISLFPRIMEVSRQVEAIDARDRDFSRDLNALRDQLGMLEDGESRVDTLKKKIEGTENELEALKSTLEEKFNLHEAVTLWRKRAGNHDTAYKWHRNFCIGFAAAMGIVGLILVLSINWDNAFSAGFSFGNAAKFALIALIGSLALVIFRIALRIALSNLHLKVESENREALASLYLNLNEQIEAAGQQELADQQRAIVLSALFAPSSVGIIKDEGFSLDPSVAAGLAKLLSKK